MVPPDHGRWLVERIPDVRDHVHPGEGHLSLAVGTLYRILADLVDLAWH